MTAIQITQIVVSIGASLTATLGGLIFAARYLGRKFDNWVEVVIDNSKAIRSLSSRVGKLEGTIKDGQDSAQSSS